MNLPDITVLELKKLMMESKYGKNLPYNVGEVYSGPTFDIEPDLNKFIMKILIYYTDLKNA